MKKKSNEFSYKVKLIPEKIENDEANIFRDKLNAIPYLLYEMEQLKDGQKIVVSKPGGKRSFGRLARNDLVVYLYNPSEEVLWQVSHKDIADDLQEKFNTEPNHAKDILSALYNVCLGKEPDFVLKRIGNKELGGLSIEKILKLYKWIWGQEDCNYPSGEGRWKSMNGLLSYFNMDKSDMEIYE